MQAAVVHRYGPPSTVRIEEVPAPEPRPNEVIVRVQATAVTAGDARIRAARFPQGFGFAARLGLGLRGPRRKVLGIVFSGTVERVGQNVTGVSPGDEVAGMSGARMGAHAEFLCVPADRLAQKPTAVSHADAAGALFGGTTALHFLRDRAKVTPGQRVLVNGASGSVGSAAVQLATNLGASVTGVTSTRNLETVRALGADTIIDYSSQPIDRLTERHDVVFDAVGTLDRHSGRRLLADDCVLILVAAGFADTLAARGQIIAGTAPERPEDFSYLLDLVASGEFNPLTHTLDGLASIAEAHEIVDSGRKVGNLVVTL